MTTHVTLPGGHAAVLSDEHAASSYGQPVLVVDGVAHSPGDIVTAPRMGRPSPAGLIALGGDYAPLDDRTARALGLMPDRLSQSWARRCERWEIAGAVVRM